MKTGKVTLELENPGNVVESVADPQFQIRATIATTADGGSTLAVREVKTQPWKIIRTWEPDEEGRAVSFSQDGKTLYLTLNHSANALRLLALDFSTGKETIMAHDPQYDVGSLFIHPVKRQIQAVAFNRDQLEWQVLDKSIAADFQAIAKVRRGEFSVISRDLADKTWLVSYKTDNGPTYYYTYDRNARLIALFLSPQGINSSTTIKISERTLRKITGVGTVQRLI